MAAGSRALAVVGLVAAETLAGAPGLEAEPGCAADAILVFDGSASMAEVAYDLSENPRIVDARAAVRRAVPDITPVRNLGLLVYGPGGADACSGIDLRFRPAPDMGPAVIDAIERLEPAGLTPLAAAVERAAEALDYRSRPAVVVLVTDGNETCGGTPCTLGTQLARDASNLRVHVIGFKVVDDFFSWNSPEARTYTGGETVAKCLADATGGLFVSTRTVDDLTDALRETLGCALIGRPVTTPGAVRRSRS